MLPGGDMACGVAQSAARQKGAHEWVLLRAFCEQHGLEKDASRMVHLAADNDWVHFLAEASADSYPYQQVRNLPSSSKRQEILLLPLSCQ